jgi:hypothetical protein
MVESATLFRRAAGVFQHLAETVLPPLQPVLPPDRCPEATVSMASIMSIVCLAEAQAVTVRRAEEKATSGGLLAKLHYGVVQFLEEAATLLRAHIGDWNDVSDKLRVQILSYNRTCDRIYFIQYMLLEALNLMGSWCASSIFLCIFHFVI